MIKTIGKGISFFSRTLTEENFKILESFLSQFEKSGEILLESLDEINSKINENTESLCEILEVDLLNIESLKEIFTNYGSKNYHSIAFIKGKFDEKKDKRVFFIQKLDAKDNPVQSNEILCLYVNNIKLEIKEWFGDKEMVIIKK